MKLVLLTDTHFLPAGRHVYGLDPRPRLEAALAVIARDHADAAALLVMGDLAHWGEDAAYRNLAEVLGTCSLPVLLMMGNHDKRGPFRAVFGTGHDDAGGFVQGVHSWPELTLVRLDTLNEDSGNHAGYLCEKRLAFLERALREAPTDRPLIVAQHHPALTLGLPAMDAIKLLNGDAELAVFERAGRRPDLMLHGHVHRPIGGLWQGIPFHIQRALSHQVAFDETTDAFIPGSHEAPDLGLLRVEDGNVVIHTRSFLYDGPVYSMSDPVNVTATEPSGLLTLPR
ncbi:MAG: metallophosphoesterase [Pseudomonadota bacterium]